jgi:hypothetical protein
LVRVDGYRASAARTERAHGSAATNDVRRRRETSAERHVRALWRMSLELREGQHEAVSEPMLMEAPSEQRDASVAKCHA